MESLYLYLLLIDFQGVLGLNTRFLGFIIAIVQSRSGHHRSCLPSADTFASAWPQLQIWRTRWAYLVEKSIIIKEY
jgi:hypothetical protein